MTEHREENILVFDVGGSHIAAGVFSADSMGLSAVDQLPVPLDGGTAEFLSILESLARRLLSSPALGVSAALPNPFDYEHGVSYMRHKYQPLYGFDLRRGLSERLHCDAEQIYFLNDAAAFLLGELHQGAAVGVDRVIGITLGTGIGSAFAIDGEIVLRGAGVPDGGEIWNLPYGDGSVESVISTLAVQKLYYQLTGIRADVRDIARLGLEHPQARQAFQQFGRELGRVLRHTCRGFAPRRIVLGGGISRAAALFLDYAEEELADPTIQLSVSQLLDRAALVGAGISWIRKLMPERMPNAGRTR